MRHVLAAAVAAAALSNGPAAAAGIEPLPANARALANDVASRASADERAWADEAGRRRPLPSYDALKAEVRSRFATRRRMSEVEIGRLAYLAVVKGFDDGVAEHARKSALVRVPTPTPAPMHHVRAGASVPTGGAVSSDAELGMITIQSLVSQRQLVVQLVTQLLGAMDTSSRTVAANIGH